MLVINILGTTVVEILRNMEGRDAIDDNVVARMHRVLAAQVTNALLSHDDDLLVSIYHQALALPYTQTAKELSAEGTGYVLNGTLIHGDESVNVCFKEGVPYVMKVCGHSEYARVCAWILACKTRGVVLSPYIIQIEAVRVPRGATAKYFFFMPLHPITLESLPETTATVLLRLYNQMSNALKSLHAMDFAHMDIKPANILVANNGDFILADFGSIVPMGNRSESTPAYLPREMVSKDRASPIASPKVDWWMLAVTVCEKACGYRAGEGAENASMQAIKDMLDVLSKQGGAEVRDIVEDLLGRL